jgi:hypothetical protein
LVAVSVAFASTVGSAQGSTAAPTEEFGPEQTRYVHCDWQSSYAERSTTQVHQVKWRDTVTVYSSGLRSTFVDVGAYMRSLESGLTQRLGIHVTCEIRDYPEYAYPSQEPGAVNEVLDGRMVTVVLHKIEPAWFFVDDLKDNIVSIGGIPSASLARLAARDPVPAHPNPDQLAGNKANKGGGGGALTVEAYSSADPTSAGKLLEAERRSAAEKAKSIAATARLRADVQAKREKMFQEMRKRGSAQ